MADQYDRAHVAISLILGDDPIGRATGGYVGYHINVKTLRGKLVTQLVHAEREHGKSAADDDDFASPLRSAAARQRGVAAENCYNEDNARLDETVGGPIHFVSLQNDSRG